MKIALTILLTVSILFLGATVSAQSELTDQIHLADSYLYDSYLGGENLLNAQKILDELRLTYPENYELYWRSARCYYYLAKENNKALDLLEKAKKFSEKAQTINPDRPEGHYWTGYLAGNIGVEKGVFQSLLMIRPMRKNLEKAIQLAPECAEAYHVLGALYYNVPGWPLSIGDKKKGLEYIKKSISLQPKSITFKWTLYNLYYDLGMTAEAKILLDELLQLEVDTSIDIDGYQLKELASKELDNFINE